jgi:hypothetical protein
LGRGRGLGSEKRRELRSRLAVGDRLWRRRAMLGAAGAAGGVRVRVVAVGVVDKFDARGVCAPTPAAAHWCHHSHIKPYWTLPSRRTIVLEYAWQRMVSLQNKLQLHPHPHRHPHPHSSRQVSVPVLWVLFLVALAAVLVRPVQARHMALNCHGRICLGGQ